MKFRCKAILLCLLALAIQPNSLWACAACYGQSDSPLAAGMNWGILSLLGTIGLVLGGIGGFFVYLARKSRAVNLLPAAQGQSLSRNCRRRREESLIYPEGAENLRLLTSSPTTEGRREEDAAYSGAESEEKEFRYA